MTNKCIITQHLKMTKHTLYIRGIITDWGFKMNRLLIIFLAFMIAISSANAWHCIDTDIKKPAWNTVTKSFGPWGDDVALGGNTTGWLNAGVIKPEGCRGIQGNIKCNDFCKNTTLIEFSCTDRPNFAKETIITWVSHENSEACGYEIPEFGTIAGALAVIGAISVIMLTRKRF
jgi:hypothetical protein